MNLLVTGPQIGQGQWGGLPGGGGQLAHSLGPPSVPASKLQLFLSKSLNPSEPQFPHLENGENVVLPPEGGSQESREISSKIK